MEREMSLYRSLAEWMPLLTPASNYRLEASIYRRLFLAHDPQTRTVLELGSGGGNNAYHLKRRFAMTLVDHSPDMLALSQQQNPECEHILGDMRTVRLDRRFDAVFIHDAIAYMTTHEDLERALTTAYVHCKPGGQLLVQPDFFRETFRPGTRHGGTDGPDRAMRYLMWIRDTEPGGCTYTTEFAFLLSHVDGHVTVERDTHTMGLFSEQQWLDLLDRVGFVGEIVGETLGEEEYSHLNILLARKCHC